MRRRELVLLRLKSMWSAVVVAIVALLLGSSPASAQVTGSISGTVKDTTGAVVPGVTVTTTNTVLGTHVTVITEIEAGTVRAPFALQARNDFMLGLVHEVVHLGVQTPEIQTGARIAIKRNCGVS